MLAATETWYRSLNRRWATTSLGHTPLSDQLMALAPLQMPARRQIIVGTTGRWTMHADNSRGGGDSVSWVGYLSGVLKCRGVIAHHVPPSQYPYPSTQFELLAPDGKPPLRYVRTISAGIYDEGRWKFLTTGAVQPFEEVERYTVRRIRDRFDRGLLVQYLDALRIRADDPRFFTTGTLLEEGEFEHQWTATLEQARAERTRPWPSPAKVSRENRGAAVALVDGRRIYPGSLGFLEQRDPFPGGHRYSLEVIAPEGGKLPKDLRNLRAAPTRGDARHVLSAVEWAMATYGYESATYEYFVNTVGQVTSDDRTISIAGVCSPVVRPATEPLVPPKA